MKTGVRSTFLNTESQRKDVNKKNEKSSPDNGTSSPGRMTDTGNVTFRIADGLNDVRTPGTICASSKAFVTFDINDAESPGHPRNPTAPGNAATRVKNVKYIIDG
jgi:hypothetical protein